MSEMQPVVIGPGFHDDYGFLRWFVAEDFNWRDGSLSAPKYRGVERPLVCTLLRTR